MSHTRLIRKGPTASSFVSRLQQSGVLLKVRDVYSDNP